MTLFTSWKTDKPMMPRDAAIRFLKARAPELSRQACDEGWQTQLLGFIQDRHELPRQDQIETMIYDHKRIEVLFSQMDRETRRKWKHGDMMKKREALKAELLSTIPATVSE